jgi:hypothetical protein
MIDLPFNSDDLGDSVLARYLRADPRRVSVLETICSLLDEDGRVGDRCRFYVVRSAYRRAVLRGTLIAEGIKLPSWACENREAATANRVFVRGYRDQYNGHRKQQRQRSDTPATRALGQALSGLSADTFTAYARASASIH